MKVIVGVLFMFNWDKSFMSRSSLNQSLVSGNIWYINGENVSSKRWKFEQSWNCNLIAIGLHVQPVTISKRDEDQLTNYVANFSSKEVAC